MSRPQWAFAGVLVVAIAWTGWLIFMVKTAANPVVVSAPQLHYATLVVAAHVTVKGETAQARIVKLFKDGLKGVRQAPIPETINVQWLARYPTPTDQLMLLALIPGQVAANPVLYEVAPIPRPDKFLPAEVYPCTDSVRIQTERILGVE